MLLGCKMRKLSKKQVLMRLFMSFFIAGSLFYNVQSASSAEYGTYTINGISYTLTEEGINPVDKSGNTIDVTISIGTGSIANIYGGYSDASDNISSNSVHIKGNGSSIALTNVYGGYVSKDGDVTDNEVNIVSSTVNQSVWGGVTGIASHSAEEIFKGNANRNKVNISSSTITLNVYGGVASDTGDASYNEVTINGSTVKKMTYGGYVYGSGNAENNKVTISNTTLSSSAYAGRVTNDGDVNGNEITVDNTNAKAIYAGYTKTGSATLNLTNIDNSSASSVYGGYVNTTGNAYNNKLSLKDSSITASAYGGRTATGSSNLNSVNIASSTINSSVYGGYVSKNGSASGNEVTVASSSVAADSGVDYTGAGTGIFGGYIANNGDAIGNKITVASSTTNYVYGGYTVSGQASENIINISGSTVKNYIYGGFVSSEGEASNNEVTITDSTGAFTCGGHIKTGNAVQNVIDIANSTISQSIYGGYSNEGSASYNIANIASSTVKSVYGAYSGNSGNTDNNTVNIIDTTVDGWVFGGDCYATSLESNNNTVNIVGSIVTQQVDGGNAPGENSFNNTVTIASSTIMRDVYGAFSSNGITGSNTVYINSGSTIGKNVAGGYTNRNDTVGNKVIIEDSSVGGIVFGGHTSYMSGSVGSALYNEVSITNSIVNGVTSETGFNGAVYGGLVEIKGDVKGNKLSIASSTINGNAYGAGTGNYGETSVNASENHLTASDSIINGNAYGGHTYRGTAEQNIIDISGGKISTNVYGGYATNGSASKNIANMSDNASGKNVYGGYSNSKDAVENIVNIENSNVENNVYGGYANTGSADRNNVNIVGGIIKNDVYGGYSVGADSKQNSVAIKHGSEITGNVYGGNKADKTGNTLTIGGKNNKIGGKFANFEKLTFDAAEVGNNDTMLFLPTTSAFDIDVSSIDVTDPKLAKGETLNLIHSEADNPYSGSLVYKIDGKQPYRDGLYNVARDDSSGIVHINEYGFEKDGNDLKLHSNDQFISASYIGKDADDNPVNLGNSDISISSVPEKINKIYGAYSDASDMTAGGAIISLEDSLDLSAVDIIGSYNAVDSTNINTTDNTLNINAAGIKAKAIDGFAKVNLGISSDETSSLTANSINLDNATINTVLDTDFNGTKTIISSTNAISKNSTAFAINGETLTGDQKYHTSKANDTNVTIGTYQYASTDNSLAITGESLISGVFRNGSQKLAATDNTLVVDSTIAAKYNEVYGAYSADGSDATGATARISEKLEADNLTVYAGYSTNAGADTKTGNVLDVTTTGAGSKIKEAHGFEKYHIALKPALQTDASMLHIGSINLDDACLDTEFSEGFNGTKTIISSDNNISHNSTTYKINGETITGDKKHYMAKANETNVSIGFYQYDTSNDKKISITGDSLIAGVYRKGSHKLAANNDTLVVDHSVASSYDEVYGAYSADDSDATGATVKISEKLDAENLNIIGGKSVGGGKVSGNTFEVSASGAGSTVNNVQGFDSYKFTVDNNQSNGKPVLQVNSINLDNASVNTDIGSGFNGTRTIIKATDSISKNDTKFAINGEILTGDQIYRISKANSTNAIVGSYHYNSSSDKKISITSNSLITGVYKNGSQQLAATDNTLVIDKAVASGYDVVYGAYSEDGSAATCATVQLSEKITAENLTLSGGHSTKAGADVKTGNTLNVEQAGNKVKAVTNFSNIGFSMKSRTASDFVMLTTTDKTNLDGVCVDVDMAGKALHKDEKVVLLDNTENKASKLLINGKEGNRHLAEDKSSHVEINTVGYTDDKDKVAIENKRTVAAGMYIDENNNSLGKKILTIGMAAGNARLAVLGPEIPDVEDIYGIYSEGTATGGVIEIVSPIDFSNTTIHGGYSTRDGLVAAGNSLVVKTLNAKVKGVTHFENMDFVLPPETVNGSTMLKVTEAVDMAPTKKVGVDGVQATQLRKGDSVNLIDSETGINNFGSQQINISGLTDKTADVVVAGKALTLTIEAEKQNPNTKAPVEGIAAAMADITAANNLTSNRLRESMVAMTSDGQTSSFAAIDSGHNKYDTGSYIKSDTLNIAFGVGKKGLSQNNPDATFGLFVQYGKSDFSTHNDSIRGDGDNEILGGGIIFHQEGKNGCYYDGNIVAGKVDTKWNSVAGGYDDSAPYYSFTFGMGTKTKHGNNRMTDVYGRYTFTHMGSMNGTIGGYDYSFNSAESSNLRLGFRQEYLKENRGKAYWGLAWEHEFEGKFNAVMNLGPTESPSLHGDTGIAEIGYEWTRCNWTYNLNFEGSFGKREGVTGSANIIYSF